MAPAVSQDQNGRDHSITVPVGTPLKLWLFSRSLRIKDNIGNDIDATNYSPPLQIAAATKRVDFMFNVAGRNDQSRISGVSTPACIGTAWNGAEAGHCGYRKCRLLCRPAADAIHDCT